ncbi:MAG: hypothetical protein ABJF10_27310 [Chthoniobacter sp.]|uniref:hypothetical protein n=1 Tax=Chthoniobacter sp. TaxID=2510640 RepID=UPI0032A401FD
MWTDGTYFEFGWERPGVGAQYGEAYFPSQAKSPLLFSDVGLALMDYGKAPPSEREAVAKKIEKAAAKLEQYLNKHSRS